MSEPKQSRSKSRFRITSIIIAVAISCSMLAMGMIPTVSTFARPAWTASTFEDYNGLVYEETFDTMVSRTWTSPTTYVTLTADWITGTIKWGELEDMHFACAAGWYLKWGSVLVPIEYYNEFMIYTFFNGSQIVGRPFANKYSDVYKLFEDSHFLVAERYAEAPHAYSGTTPEWNLTERLTWNKHDPLIRFDTWIRNLNSSSQIKALSHGHYVPEPKAGLTDYTVNISYTASRGLRIVYNNSGQWAVGHLGSQLYYENDVAFGTPFSHAANDTWVQMRDDLGAFWHSSGYLIVGQTRADIISKVDRLGSSWNWYLPWDALNLYYAQNEGQSYDALSFSNTTTFSYRPSGLAETVWGNGDWFNRTFLQNPIQNFFRPPVILSLDLHDEEIGNPSYRAILYNLFNFTQIWDTRWALAIQFAKTYQGPPPATGNITDAMLRYFYNQSLVNSGTLLEIGSHFWNHSSFLGHPEYVHEQENWSNDRWNAISGRNLTSGTLAGNHWHGRNSLEVMFDAGLYSVRLDVISTDSTHRLLSDSGLFAYCWRSITPATIQYAGDEFTKELLTRGYFAIQSHLDNFGDESYFLSPPLGDTRIADFFSWVENSTYALWMTQSQWYDILAGNIGYIASDQGIINMTDALASHRLFMSPGANGYPVFKDPTGVTSYHGMKAGQYYFDAPRGREYSEVMRMSPTLPEGGRMSINLTAYDPSQTTVARWTTNSDSMTSVAFTLFGLESGIEYHVYVDDNIVAKLTASAGSISFSYSAWSSHEFTVLRPTTYAPDEEPLPSSERSPATTTPGETTFSWTSLSMIAIASCSILILAVLLMRRSRGRTGRRYS